MSDEGKSDFTVARWDALFGQRKEGKVVSSPDSKSLNEGYVKTMEKRMPIEGTQDDLTLAAVKLYIIELHQHCLMRMVELEQMCHTISVEQKMFADVVAQFTEKLIAVGATTLRTDVRVTSVRDDLASISSTVNGIHEFLLQVPGYSESTDQPLNEEHATGTASSLDGTWPTDNASTTALG